MDVIGKHRRTLLAVIIASVMALVMPSAAFADDTALTAGTANSMGVSTMAGENEAPSTSAFKKSSQILEVDNSKGGLLANGTYFIVSADDATRVIGSKGAIQAKAGIASQKWKIKFDTDSQSYTIINTSSGRALTANNKAKHGSSVTESKLKKKNQRLSAYASRTIAIPTQRWILKSNNKGYYFVSAANKKIYLDMSGAQVRVVKNKTSGWLPYIWFVGASGTYNKNGIGNGTYTITSVTNSSKILNIGNSSIAKKSKARVARGKTSWGQMFDFVYAKNGYYKILNYNSGYALTAKGSSVIQYPYQSNMKDKQLWQPKIVSSDGSVQFINKKTGKALAVQGNSVVLQKKSASSKAQRWTVNPTATGLTEVGKKALYWANKYKSVTQNSIVIDLTAHEYFLFKKAIPSRKSGPWVLEDTCRCASGRNYATEGGTPGHPYISRTSDYAVHKPGRINGKWCVSISGGSDLHSITYDGAQGDNQLGWFLSGGCIRLPFKNAEYVYKNTEPGTRVIRYYK